MQKNRLNLQKCSLCPRACGVDRENGQKGICGQTAVVKAARAGLHMWEEPCISGARGSGTVFFSGCALHCVYCQNHEIANGTAGKEISIGRLAEIFLELQEQGADNINLVTAGHFLPQVICALEHAKDQGLVLPVVYNTSSYESVDAIRSLEGHVDVYLPDLKYKSREVAQRYSHAPDYFEAASAVIKEMVRQTKEIRFVPEPVLEESVQSGQRLWQRQPQMAPEEYDIWQEQQEEEQFGIMVRGTIVRHLLLPGQLEDSKQLVKYLLDTYGDGIYLSLMSQYTPQKLTEATYPELARKVTPQEYDALLEYALEQGLNYGFMQDGEAAEESFIPQFDGAGI